MVLVFMQIRIHAMSRFDSGGVAFRSLEPEFQNAFFEKNAVSSLSKTPDGVLVEVQSADSKPLFASTANALRGISFVYKMVSPNGGF